MASDLDLGSDHLRWMGEASSPPPPPSAAARSAPPAERILRPRTAPAPPQPGDSQPLLLPCPPPSAAPSSPPQARFDVYALWRILTLRRYPGSLRVRAKGRDEWQTFEGPFVGLWALNCRWLTATAQLGPRAEFDDGCEDLMLVRRAGRLTLLCTFLDLESGKHADASFVEYLKAEEFELTPLPRTEREPGMVAIDGELMPFATTHVSVLPSKLTMLGGAVPPAEDPGAP
jgi:hypothetical protein